MEVQPKQTVTGIASKKARAAHTNISALNALRESIELNEKLRKERKDKKKMKLLDDPNWKTKLSSSDSDELEESESSVKSPNNDSEAHNNHNLKYKKQNSKNSAQSRRSFEAPKGLRFNMPINIETDADKIETQLNKNYLKTTSMSKRLIPSKIQRVLIAEPKKKLNISDFLKKSIESLSSHSNNKPNKFLTVNESKLRRQMSNNISKNSKIYLEFNMYPYIYFRCEWSQR